MPEFLSNLFQYRSDYIWCNNKMDDDFFLLFHLFLTKLPGIYILPFFTICFHEKLIKSLKRSRFCFSIAFFDKKNILYEKSRENLFFNHNQAFRKNKILHCTAMFSRKTNQIF